VNSRFESYTWKKAANEYWERNQKLCQAIRQMSEKKERWHYLERNAFRWHLNNEVLSGAYEGMSLEQVCKDNKFRVWEQIDKDSAIVERPSES